MNSLTDFANQVAASGFAIIPGVLEHDDLALLERLFPPSSSDSGGLRNLLDIPAVAELAESGPIRALVDPILGRDAFPVRGILFDKAPAANWKVSWHQDLTIAVKHRSDAAGLRSVERESRRGPRAAAGCRIRAHARGAASSR